MMTSLSRDIALVKQKRKKIDQSLNTDLVRDLLILKSTVFNW